MGRIIPHHGTDTFPYLIGAMRGEVSLDPNTSSPQTQIIPQARTQAFRDPLHGIDSGDLIITTLTENGSGNGYLLEYTSRGIDGSVEYSWDESGLYTFVFNDVDGRSTTETFQREDIEGGTAAPPEPPADTTNGDGSSVDGGTTGNSSGTMVLTSPAVEDGELLDDFKCERKDEDGVENSIPLAWSGVPSDAASLAIIMHHFPKSG